LATGLVVPAPAHASPGPNVTVSPATAQPGAPVTITADCGKGASEASAASAAFPVPVPLTRISGVLTGAVLVPDGTAPQAYQVTLSCPGEGISATTMLTVVGPSARAPAPRATAVPGATLAPSGTPTTPGTGGRLLLIGGLTALLAGTLVGLVALVRRRRRGTGRRAARPGAHRRGPPARRQDRA
jgi:hypothetical protein